MPSPARPWPPFISRHYLSVTVWLVSGQDGAVRDRLRLFPDYGAETPVWSRRGMVSFNQLKITDSLRADLVAWQKEALDASDERAERSEEEWAADRKSVV